MSDNSLILPPAITSPCKVRKPRRVWDIKLKPTTSLERAVVRLLKDGCDGCELKSHIRDVCNHGCQSGVVGGLIYYSDTLKFYMSHKRAIQDLLSDMLSDVGVKSPGGLFGDKWDADDMWANDTANQNLLAWFAMEAVTRQLARQADDTLDI